MRLDELDLENQRLIPPSALKGRTEEGKVNPFGLRGWGSGYSRLAPSGPEPQPVGATSSAHKFRIRNKASCWPGIQGTSRMCAAALKGRGSHGN